MCCSRSGLMTEVADIATMRKKEMKVGSGFPVQRSGFSK